MNSIRNLAVEFETRIILRLAETECSVCIFATECKFIAVLVLCEIDPELESSGIQVSMSTMTPSSR